MEAHIADAKPKRVKRKLDKGTIPEAWKEILERNYSVFRNRLQIDKLIEQMSFTDQQQNEFKDMLDDHQRIEHLIMHILRNGTKSLVEEFKMGLKLSGQEDLIPYTPRSQTKPRRKRQKFNDMPIMIHVYGPKYVKLMKLKNHFIVNIREYITGVDGKLYPTKKGIVLSLDAWNALMKVDEIVQRM